MHKPTVAEQFEKRITTLLHEMREARMGIYGHDNSLYLVFGDGSVITDVGLTGRKDPLEGEFASDEIVAFSEKGWANFSHGLYDWSF